MTKAEEQQIKDNVENGIKMLFVDAHQTLETKSGDISVIQNLRLHKIEKELAELIIEQVNQNL